MGSGSNRLFNHWQICQMSRIHGLSICISMLETPSQSSETGCLKRMRRWWSLASNFKETVPSLCMKLYCIRRVTSVITRLSTAYLTLAVAFCVPIRRCDSIQSKQSKVSSGPDRSGSAIQEPGSEIKVFFSRYYPKAFPGDEVGPHQVPQCL